MDPEFVITGSAWAATGIISAGMIFAFLRILLGPSLSDRVVALDALATMGVGALVLVAIATRQPVLLDIALAMALITFLGSIALALSIQKGIFK